MTNIPVLPRGDYRVHLGVLAPAPEMAGRSQHLVARYELCGLEGLVRVLAAVLAFASASLAVGSAVLGRSLLGPRVARQRQPVGQDRSGEDDGG